MEAVLSLVNPILPQNLEIEESLADEIGVTAN